MKSKVLLYAMLCVVSLFSCNKEEKDPHKHFAGKRKDPSSAAHLIFHDLSRRDSTFVNDSVTFVYRFNNNGFQTAKIESVQNQSAYCKCKWPDSLLAGKTDAIKARCAFEGEGIFKGVFDVYYKGKQEPISLTYYCTVKAKK